MAERGPSNARRRFLELGLGSLLLLPFAGPARAAGRLREDDPAALALGYRHDADEVDIERFPKRAGPEGAAQFCANCRFLGGPVEDEWRPCSLFENRLVNARGWCNSWLPFE
ncbi:MAG: high-potential iron-sulfur protein [Gammaproteobacteria bacterium]